MARSKSKKKRTAMMLQQKHKAYAKRHKVTRKAAPAKPKPAAVKKKAKKEEK
ncbi:hypothetical protein JXO59_03210 [candidate division KSB1 bacterium]|nr:hypothetical protein [candidate division KSB1 bacterium]